ncbi:hypothetical protein Mesop_3211 [Mesorhizobium opportunistum WSM2075]|uniref:Uncharacterized protein n=1 Tax=Mesorhizobium opportunistum (strain LMG 24607 / HAMBI 3007 / WSM2075) TaxID=536019 RepID=F7YAI5_MESOW|nr:hypothetical protein Mesop_3211 [Mesorhizobium opportunistum WSM2075]
MPLVNTFTHHSTFEIDAGTPVGAATIRQGG